MSSAQRGGDRHVHQDYIARIRYSNALPPPPNPPKLLDMPGTGLLDSQYTTPAFASRLAREQSLNIETDAEMGMPIDLVGLPGVFDGDESAILAPDKIPTPDARDLPLLRPLHSLGKPRVQDGGVSFMRRTDYAASSKKTVNPFMQRAKRLPPKKRQSPEPNRDSPAYIKRKIDESFAAAEKCRNGHIKHPSRIQARRVATMPLLPDLSSFPDSGAYVTVKFTNNPVPKSSVYDSRMSAGLFRPIPQTEEEEQPYFAALHEWELGGKEGPPPAVRTSYDFYLADGPASASKFHQKLDLDNPDREDESLYSNRNSKGQGVFSLTRVRAYDTVKETELEHSSKYSQELLLTIKEGPDGVGTVAYYLPAMARTTLQAQRSRNIARTNSNALDQQKTIDQLDIRMEEPTQQMLDTIQKFRDNPEYNPLGGQEENENEGMANGGGGGNIGGVDEDAQGDVEDDDADADADADANGDEIIAPNLTQIAPRGFENDSDDAEGEEE